MNSRFADAEQHAHKAYEITEKNLNPDHPGLEVTLHNLALAIDMYQHLLECMGASFYEIDRRTNMLREGNDPGPAKIEERTILKRI
jgi:hypothetical protein